MQSLFGKRFNFLTWYPFVLCTRGFFYILFLQSRIASKVPYTGYGIKAINIHLKLELTLHMVLDYSDTIAEYSINIMLYPYITIYLAIASLIIAFVKKRQINKLY